MRKFYQREMNELKSNSTTTKKKDKFDNLSLNDDKSKKKENLKDKLDKIDEDFNDEKRKVFSKERQRKQKECL